MALVVEAAELAGILQWMTPEQSQAARGDLVLQEQVADEVADVPTAQPRTAVMR